MVETSESMASSTRPRRMRRWRRRQRSPAKASRTGTAIVVPCALLLLSSAALVRDGGTATALEPRRSGERRNRDEQALRRRLREQKEATLAEWRSLREQGLDLTNLRPLDLVLDETDPTHQRVYQKGDGGFLEPYDFDNYQSNFVGSIHLGAGSGTNSTNDNDHPGSGGSGDPHPPPAFSRERDEMDTHHHSSGRMGLTNFDLGRGIGPENGAEPERGLRGLAVEIDDRRSPFFRYTEENDPEESEEYETIEPFDRDGRADRTPMPQPFDDGRLLGSSQSYHGKSSVRGFVGPSDTAPPIIRAAFPPVDTAIGSHQTFGALVSDNGTGVKKVCVQFKDHQRSRSDCFELRNAGGGDGDRRRTSDVWELSFEGFASYAGQSWEYRVRSVDGARNRRSTGWRTFRIDGGTAGSRGGATDSGDEGDPDGPPPPAAEKLVEEAKDENWPHGGVVQTSTGRILFFFDGNPYVCTGTVLQSPRRDRTVVLTAGHCAYQYRDRQGGRFAEHALFIPNQADTRGARSNEVCSDDPLGCWIPAFAVVHRDWTTRGFPNSVEWDYAYYVIPNQEGAHEGGFVHEGQPGLSKLLEEIVEPLPVDFGWDGAGELTHGLGYSFNKDPAFRYCADRASTNFGVDAYENLWLGNCEMTGGSSGGPWMVDVDTDGRGTVVSVNSWGYATSPGMGGPNFATSAGSKAQCLYHRAMDAKFEDVRDRGIIVDYC